MSYGFVIDNRRCIGCHACTVACKAEHEVPLGHFRTWVKYVERGAFPDVRRYFTVLRCNHCSDAPCVNICPTGALFHRVDGIVDFDGAQCIACKSCMVACPYEAIYLDPETETAAKCNFCAHKVEVGLQPACVTVCPVQAIVAGNVDAPASRISELIAQHGTAVRSPGKGTRPNVHYIQADTSSLTPGDAPRRSLYLWAERPEPDLSAEPVDGWGAGAAETVYDVNHEKPWGRLVSLYFWTKSLSTGPMILASLLTLLGVARAPQLFGRVAPMFALVTGFLTTLFLVGDLERPERFLKILYRPNPRSWLVWGAYILIFYSGTVFLWAAAGTLQRGAVIRGLVLPALVIAVLTAGYSGFLLAQARGRDLWRSKLIFPHLVAQALVAGSAVLGLASLYRDSGRPMTNLFLRWLLASVCAHGLFVLGEIALPVKTREWKGAVQHMVQGPLSRPFWLGAVLAGIALPIYALAFYFNADSSSTFLPACASLAALLGLLAYEDCYIRAGQALPLS